jgi:DNA-binding IclR family transcriptional regulator
MPRRPRQSQNTSVQYLAQLLNIHPATAHRRLPEWLKRGLVAYRLGGAGSRWFIDRESAERFARQVRGTQS